ncbi:MAG: homoserine kinase [Oligoflexia bacterium]|nr:homoserine kinase [Oligoflexia bacterium]
MNRELFKTAGSVTAFAPATVANVAVGFDILGFSVDGVGDEVTVSVLETPGKVEVIEISGVVTDLPKQSSKNTAAVALHAMIDDLGLPHGFSIRIKKGIAMGSGMGGSAASAVGAVVAAGALLTRLDPPFRRKPLLEAKLLEYALQGEKAASGAIHGDNVGPCLKGGLTLILPSMAMVSIPTPRDVFALLVHPDLEIETRQARGILKKEVPLSQWVEQSSWLGGFLAGCFKSDLELIRASMKDVVIEPQRAQLIPGFSELKAEALKLGALGFSISGSGPSVFAWVPGKELAENISRRLIEIFRRRNISAHAWVTPLSSPGARVRSES